MVAAKLVGMFVAVVALWTLLVPGVAFGQEQCTIRQLDQGSGSVKICIPVQK